jgi:D-alanyl-lipoteichoic acid acyltransferase DltB (MBOAT superfamily)
VVFTSPLFLFVFLPLAWGGWQLFARPGARERVSLAYLIAVSLIFYAWWHVPNLAVLGASIATNYLLGRSIASGSGRARMALLWTGIIANLALLAVFKYYAFFTGQRIAVILPLAISFFTFTQIAFLVDVSRGQVRETSVVRYVFFVVFFPHLIAGPIVRLQEIQGQLRNCLPRHLTFDEFRAGTTLILIGLAKKVLIADTLAPASDVLFSGAFAGAVSAPMAWVGALCFYLQIYFDFSGYTDIALGLARLFVIRFPENFDYPYSAASIIDFWRRWHITLSRFLRDYVYIPLGGSRHGEARRYASLIVTMLLGGLWHGAGWTFVAWGGLHGVGLAVNHAVRRVFPEPRTPVLLRVIAAQAFVFFAWIFFRAADFGSAWRVLQAMPGPWSLTDPGLLLMVNTTNVFFQMVFRDPAFNAGLTGLALFILLAMAAATWRGAAVAMIPQAALGRWPVAGPMRVALAGLVIVVIAGRVSAGHVIQPFIYFQF